MYWANFLRDKVFLQGAGWETRGGNPSAQWVFQIEPGETEAQATKRLVATGALLCRDASAATLPGAVCSADMFADQVIEGSDLSAVLWGYGTTVAERYGLPTADVNRDGEVNGIDLAEVLNHWGSCVP